MNVNTKIKRFTSILLVIAILFTTLIVGGMFSGNNAVFAGAGDKGTYKNPLKFTATSDIFDGLKTGTYWVNEDATVYLTSEGHGYGYIDLSKLQNVEANPTRKKIVDMIKSNGGRLYTECTGLTPLENDRVLSTDSWPAKALASGIKYSRLYCDVDATNKTIRVYIQITDEKGKYTVPWTTRYKTWSWEVVASAKDNISPLSVDDPVKTKSSTNSTDLLKASDIRPLAGDYLIYTYEARVNKYDGNGYKRIGIWSASGYASDGSNLLLDIRNQMGTIPQEAMGTIDDDIVADEAYCGRRNLSAPYYNPAFSIPALPAMGRTTRTSGDVSVSWEESQKTQTFVGVMDIDVKPPTIKASLIKIAAKVGDQDITSNNNCYGNLEDAEYTIYTDYACTDSTGKVLKGDGTEVELNPAKYYVKETKAPKGYVKDTKVYTIDVPAGETARLKVEDVPLLDPVNIEIYKADAATGEKKSQGSGDLGNAQFEFAYYDSYFSTLAGASGKTAKNVLVYKTNENGQIATRSELFLVSGIPYKNASGGIMWPLGTVVIKEKSAPVGYLMSDEVFIVQFKLNPAGDKVDIAIYDSKGNELKNDEAIQIGNIKHNIIANDDEIQYPFAEPPICGGVELDKTIIDTKKATEGDASVTGIRFAIINDSANAVFVDDVSYAKGKVVKILTIDANGHTTTSKNELPYGEYFIAELKQDSKVKVGDTYSVAVKGESVYANESVLWKENIHKFAIREADKIVNLSQDTAVDNTVVNGKGEIKKSDADTEKSQGDASFEGISYAVINVSKDVVQYNGVNYEPNIVVDKITLDKSGVAQIKTIPYGTYRVVELRADSTVEVGKVFSESQIGKSIYANKNGYLYKEYSKELSVTKQDEILVFENANPIVRRGIILSKLLKLTRTNEEGDINLKGIKFAVITTSEQPVFVNGKAYNKGQVVFVGATNDKGVLITDNNLLPYGSYRIVELRRDSKVVVGVDYANADKGKSEYSSIDDSVLFDESKRDFTVREQGDKPIDLGEMIKPIVDEASKGHGEIQKTDIDNIVYQGDAGFKGITYALVNASKYKVVYKGKSYPVGAIVDKLVVDNNGKAVSGDLEFGTYTLVELRKDNAYNVGDIFANSKSKEGTSIYANDDGYLYKAYINTQSIRHNGEVLEFTNDDPIITGTISITKFDAEIDKNEPQGAGSLADIRYAIVNRSKEEVMINKIKYEPGTVVEIVTTDKSGNAKTKQIPYGTYDVYELRKDATIQLGDSYDNSTKLGTSIYSNDSYLHTDDIQTANVNEKYEVESITNKIRAEGEDQNDKFSNFPVRGDLKFNKYDIDGNPYPYIPFLVSLLDENGKVVESHVIVADAKGVVNTQTRENKTPTTVNTLDKYAKDGKYTGPLDASASSVNIWFGTTKWADNTRGSMFYGNYKIEELQCSNNKGQDMLTTEVVVSEEKTVFEPDNVIVDLNIRMESKALDVRSDSNVISLGTETEVKDTVKITHLKTYNTYELVTEIVNVKKDGTTVSVGKSEPYRFVPKKSDDTQTAYETIVNTFKVDSSKLEPGSYVAAVDYLYIVKDGKSTLLQTHNKYYNVEEQKLLVPDMNTVAIDYTTNSRVGALEPNAVIGDEVIYKNLGNKVLYKMIEELFYDDGKAVKDVNGKNAKSEMKLYIDYRNVEMKMNSNNVMTGGKDGTFYMPKFEVASEKLAGRHITIKQTLIDEITGDVVLVHNKDLNVEKETVRWIDIKTEASSVIGNGIVPTNAAATIVDTITYTNLAEMTSVKIHTVVAEKTSKETVAESVTNDIMRNGSGVIRTKTTLDTTPYAGKELVLFEYIYKVVDGKDVLIGKHEDIKDIKQTVRVPKAETTATDSVTGDHITLASEQTTIVDRVKYTNLLEGHEYTVTGTLMIKEKNEPLKDKDGNVITSSKTFVAEKRNGYVDLEFTFDSSLLAGETLVAFETVKYKEYEVVTHADINDEDQSVDFPEIGTETSEKLMLAGKIQLVDIVKYENLPINREYIVYGKLMDKETGEVIRIDGKEVLAEAKFTPKEKTGEIEVVFEFDATTLAGKTAVVFERVLDVKTNSIIGKHEDIEDENQTVDFPKVGTSVAGHEMFAGDEVVLVDTIEYENLVPGETYKASGYLVDKDGENIEVDGAPITAEATFTPESKNGTVDVTFKFNAKTLAGTTVVVFEEVFDVNGRLVGEHKDTEDDKQTVDFPKVQTQVGQSDIFAGEIELIDTISYSKLTIGETYVAKGILVDKDGKPVLIDDREITSETEFKAEKEDGTVDVIFKFNAKVLEGTSVVVFEEVYSANGTLVAEHKDTEDDKQTAHVPSFQTEVGQSEVVAKEITLIDTITYTNVTPGETYTAKGILVNQNGEPVIVNGKTIVSEQTFTPKEADGTVDVTFKFDATVLEGQSIVVFEEVYNSNGILIGEHKDVNDEKQTATVTRIRTKVGESILNAGEVILTDTISYEGLTPGETYTAKGVLVDQKGKVVKVDGKEITAETTFRPKEENGTVDVTFKFNAKAFEGKSLVVFEEMYNAKGQLVGEHKDTDDKNQTTTVTKIRTKIAKTHVDTNDNMTLTDVIIYSGLTVGEKYVAKGVLVDKGGKPILIDGKEITAETEFIADAAGKTEVIFKFNVKTIKGETVVVFEEVYDASGRLIGEHKDTNDKNQTVKMPKPETPDTGDRINFLVYTLLISLSLLGLVAVAIRRKRLNA